MTVEMPMTVMVVVTMTGLLLIARASFIPPWKSVCREVPRRGHAQSMNMAIVHLVLLYLTLTIVLQGGNDPCFREDIEAQ